MSARKIQVILIGGALILFVLLFIAPKTTPPKSTTELDISSGIPATKISTDATIDVYLNTALKNSEPQLKQQFDRLLAAKQFDSLSAFWDKLKFPDLASYFAEEKAKKEKTAQAWFKAGNRYYYAIRFLKDKTEMPILYQCAMRCFNKGLELEPANIDAKIMLASCYVEGTENPMEGVARLREVEKTDSNNVKLQLTFAFFSVKSGQYDRAIARFNKVLKIDSTYIEAYLHLADVYEQQNNTDKTIEALSNYSNKTLDITAKTEIDNYIKQLKK
jgi:tetratricopeptide (TPR) repeat protein